VKRKKGVLKNSLQNNGFEIICTKTEQISQMAKPFRGDQDENNRVVNSWEGNDKELETRTKLLKVN
jgi:hypothetical protein